MEVNRVAYQANRVVFAWIMLVGLRVNSERAETSGGYGEMNIYHDCFSVTADERMAPSFRKLKLQKRALKMSRASYDLKDICEVAVAKLIYDPNMY